SSRRRHTRCLSDWSSDVCSSDLQPFEVQVGQAPDPHPLADPADVPRLDGPEEEFADRGEPGELPAAAEDHLGRQVEVLNEPAAEIGRASCRERGWMSEVDAA